MKFIAIFFLFLSFSLFALDTYHFPPADSGQEMIMPDLTGLDEFGVLDKLKDFNVQIINRKGTPAPTLQLTGQVQVQDPLRGEKLQAGQYVRVTYFSPFIPDRLVPNIVGLKVDEAKDVIAKNNLFINETDKGEPRYARDAFRIFWQKPSAGERVPIGTTVNYKVNINYLPRAPNVVGDYLEVAKTKIDNEGLKYSVEVGPPAKLIDQQNRVFAQDPRYGTPLNMGDTVTIKVYDQFIEQTTPHVVPQYQIPF